jgi:excisionase family DNA binding protein
LENLMSNGFNFDALLDILAERVSARVRADLAPELAGAVKPRLLTVDQAAVYLGRSRDATQHLLSSGNLPAVRSDRRIFIDVQDLDRWIDENKTTAL